MRCLIKYRLRGEEAVQSFEFSNENIELEEVVARFKEYLAPGGRVRLAGVQAMQRERTAADEQLKQALAYIKNECHVQAWFYKKSD